MFKHLGKGLMDLVRPTPGYNWQMLIASSNFIDLFAYSFIKVIMHVMQVKIS
jgi:hypothetical protein